VLAAIVLAFRYVSLGSILAIAMFPLGFRTEYGHAPVVLACFTLISVLIIGRHHKIFSVCFRERI